MVAASDTKQDARRYHHGDLRAALIAAGEDELAEKGYQGFTLRGCARRAGVSHAAPAHHFADVDALLTAIAARGFEELSAEMRRSQRRAAQDIESQLIAAGIGYFRFGGARPNLLELMFDQKRPFSKDPALSHNASEAFLVLMTAVSSSLGRPAAIDDAARRMVAATWSVVHGYTMLTTAGRLSFLDTDDIDAREKALAGILTRMLKPEIWA